MLEVDNIGTTFGHLVLPLGQNRVNREVLVDAIRRASISWQATESQEPPVQSIDMFSVPGPCDLLIRLRVEDFRFIPTLQAYFLDTTAQAASWLFSVPYKGGSLLSELPGGSGGAVVHYTKYLRICRDLYRAHSIGAEETIVESIHDLIGQFPDICGEVQYSLGWPDLIVHGYSTATPEVLMSFLARISSLKVRARYFKKYSSFYSKVIPAHHLESGTSPVFRKAFSVLGFHVMDFSPRDALDRGVWQASPEEYSRKGEEGRCRVHPIVRARALPGSFESALSALKQAAAEAFGTCERTILMTDGRWDFQLVSANQDKASTSPENFYRVARENSQLFRDSGIERTESHILSFEAEEIAKEISRSEDSELLLKRLTPVPFKPRSRFLQTKPKFAAKVLPNLRREEIISLPTEIVPKSLRTTISDTLASFNYLFQDAASSGDALHAIRGYENNLSHLLQRTMAFNRLTRLASDPVKQSGFFVDLKDSLHMLGEWCLTASRVISERTSGSFHRIFHYSDTIAPQRGGLQKVLFLADNLMQEFYARLPSCFKVSPYGPLIFISVQEPESTISTAKLLGVIKIPARHAFSIHLITPQLWHEVAQHIFIEVYRSPLPEKLNRRLLYLSNVLREEQGRSESNEISIDPQNITLQLSDMVADLLVFHYGFRRDLDSFVRYLSSLTLDASIHDSVPPSEARRRVVSLLLRTYFVIQYEDVYRKIAKSRYGDGGGRQKTIGEILQEHEQAPLVEELLSLVRVIKDDVVDSPRYAGVDVEPLAVMKSLIEEPERLVGAVRRKLKSHAYRSFFVKFLEDIAEAALL